MLASCQLLLPSGNEGTGGDQSSSAGHGGAMTTSSHATSGSTSSATTSGSEATSSSTGGLDCSPGGVSCQEDKTFIGCATSLICPGNADCSGYCAEVGKCADADLTQYGTKAECCAVCELALNTSDTTNSLCCRADALKLGPNHAPCTIAGPFGTTELAPNSLCGAQNVHVCDLLFTVCQPFVPTLCTKEQCEAAFTGATTNKYVFGSDQNDPIGAFMDLTLTAIDAPDKATACATAFAEVCMTAAQVSVGTGG